MPSIGHLLDHTARIWERFETKDEYGGTVPRYEPVDGQTAVPCASDGQDSVLAPVGPGLDLSGDRWLYFDIGPTLRKRWLVELVTGPTAPAWLEIESVDAFRGNHIEVRVSEFVGKRPEVGS